MKKIKIKEIENPIPSFAKDRFEISNQEVKQSDWEEYLTALRTYCDAYFKLKEKITNKS